ncbi:MAG: phosphoribosyl-AMP cyclohydrolase [Pseudomonadota bacterium]
MSHTDAFPDRGTPEDIEAGALFQPKFDGEGLIPAIVTDAETGRVLMFAWMDRAALRATIETGFGHFYSRSRKRQWMKGEESGNTLRVQSLRTDCDQDVVQMVVHIAGNGVACHTGAVSCFYRELDLENDETGTVLRRIG